MPDKLQDWEKDTPAELLPAVKHIRNQFDESALKCSEITKRLCYAALHPAQTDLELAPYAEVFPAYRQIVGRLADKEFARLLGLGTPPSLFKAFFDIHRAGLNVEVKRVFNELFQIILANIALSQTHPVQWAQGQMRRLIQNRRRVYARWVKEVCDKQELYQLKTDENIEERIAWVSWRAPKLIHMQPSGNTRYDPEIAWDREDEATTQKLLQGLSERWFLDLLEMDLEKTAGSAHVSLAKQQSF